MKKLGKYEVLSELGRGAMGVVYRARDPIINRHVAVKTITTGVADDPGLLQRFYREAQSAGGLQHPNIVTIYDMGEQGDVPYIAMELIEGESLEKIIARRTALPISLKLVYAIQACRAFDCAHKRGIVHRDIKPANVMVTKDGTIKVVDFGIARVVEASETRTGMLIGTFAYMSPEQYHGEHADERSDIWSFGVLLYEFLCGRKPFTGATPPTLMHSICDQEPAPLSRFLPECPKDLELVIAKTLQKSPSERFQSMEDLLVELEPLCKRFQAQSVAELVEQSRRCVEENQFADARDVLRQALQIDSGNQQVRAMLEKVNAELKRVQVRPRAQQLVKEGRAFLEEGKILDAKVAAESALSLDTGFEPARDLQRLVRERMDRAQLVAGWLDAAKQHLAEGLPEEAEALLVQALQAEPSNKQAAALQRQALREKIERQKRLRLLAKLRDARSLWTHQEYSSCIQLLVDLRNEFPEEEEVSRLLETVREDQLEHRRQALAESQNLLDAGRYEECFALLTKLQGQFPQDHEIPAILLAARKNQIDHDRLQRLSEARGFLAASQYDHGVSLLNALSKEFPDEPGMAELLENARRGQREQGKQQRVTKARELLAERRYAESASLLMALKKEFPGDAQIVRLLDVVRGDQVEQRKREGLTEARKLLASRRYDQAINVLTALQADFPSETEIGKLLETARSDQAEQYKQQKLAEARAHLAAQSFAEAVVSLEALVAVYPKDPGVLKLLGLVQCEQEKYARNQRIERELDILKKLMSEKKYPEVIAKTKQLLIEFPGETNFRRLAEFASSHQESLEKDLVLRRALEEPRAMVTAHRFKDAVAAAQSGLKLFPGNPELLSLLQEAELHQKKQESQRQIEERVRQIRFKINREEFSDAIDLARNTLVTLGPDTHVSQLLNSAQVEVDAREKKKVRIYTLETIRTLIESGQLEAAKQALNQALETKTVEDFDPNIQRLSEQLKDAKSVLPGEPSPNAPVTPAKLSSEYAYFQRTPPSPPPPQNALDHGPVTSQGAATKRALSPQPVTPGQPTGQARPLPPQGGQPAQSEAAASPKRPDESLEVTSGADEGQKHSRWAAPVFTVQPAHPAGVPMWRRPAVVTVLALAVVAAAVWVGVRSMPPTVVVRLPPKDKDVVPPPPPPDTGQLAAKQRTGLDDAGKLIAANNLDEARGKLMEAAALNGPLTAEIQRRISAINESEKDPDLRERRRREEQLFQQGLKQLGDERYMAAEKTFRQILAFGPSGVHKDDARTYLDEVIPKHFNEADLMADAHFDLTQGEFQSARSLAVRLKENGSDTTKLLTEIDLAEQTQLAKLENEFNGLRERDNDAAVQALSALWPKFQELATANGPRSGEALDYVNGISDAMNEVQGRMQQKSADASFQRMVQAYQKAARLNDKSGLTAAATDFESIVKGDGPHADEARSYLADVNEKLTELSQFSPKPEASAAELNRENSVRAAIQLYAHAFEQKDADALLKVWPNSVGQYVGYKLWFEKAASIRMQVDINSVEISKDGATAVVKAQVSRNYTPIGSKTTYDRDTVVFQLSREGGSWVITDKQGGQSLGSNR